MKNLKFCLETQNNEFEITILILKFPVDRRNFKFFNLESLILSLSNL